VPVNQALGSFQTAEMAIRATKKNMSLPTVWIFNGAKASFPSGVFNSRAEATAWIERHKLSGVLTEYPVGVGIFDWAVANRFFTPNKPAHQEAKFIQSFTSARQTHEHYEAGELIA
jgi:hypothetical protein